MSEENKKMPRFEDYRSDPEVRDIVESFVKKFPRVFEGFTIEDIGFVVTQKKKLKGKHPIKVRTVPYPHFVFSGKTYIFETYETKWQEYNKKQKNLAVFHAMCGIPVGGFDPASKAYGKLVKPDFELYRFELAAAGGVADWFEDDSARDPMEIDAADIPVLKKDDGKQPPLAADDDEDPIPADDASKATGKKFPLTADDVANAGTGPTAAAS